MIPVRFLRYYKHSAADHYALRKATHIVLTHDSATNVTFSVFKLADGGEHCFEAGHVMF